MIPKASWQQELTQDMMQTDSPLEKEVQRGLEEAESEQVASDVSMCYCL